MNRRHIIATILLSGIATLFQSIISFLIAPLVTNMVGVEAYGFVTLAKNFASYADIVMIALNSFAARFISISYLRKDYHGFKKYYCTVFFADILLGGIILLFGGICVLNLENLIKIPQEIVSDVKILFALTFLAFFLTTISTVFSSTAYVKDKLDIYNVVRAAAYLAQIVILLSGFILLDSKIWYVGVATLGTSIIMLAGSWIMSRFYLPDAVLEIGYFDKGALKDLFSNGIWNSINSLGNSLNSGLDLLITNLMLSTVGMGQLSICKTVSNIVFALYGVLGQPFHPLMLRYYSSSDQNGLMRVFRRAMQVCGLFTNIVFAGFVALGPQFYSLWIPNQDIGLIYRLTIIALLPCISEGCVYPLLYIYTLTVKNRIPCLITIIGGLLNVISMYFLIRFTSLGLYAVLLTTAIIMNIIYLITNPLYMTSCLKISKGSFYPQIIRHLISCAVTVLAVEFFSTLLVTNGGWINFIVNVVILSIIGFVVQLPVQVGFSDFTGVIWRYLKSILHE